MVQRQLQMKQNIGQINWLDNTPNQPSKFGAKNGLQQVMIHVERSIAIAKLVLKLQC